MDRLHFGLAAIAAALAGMSACSHRSTGGDDGGARPATSASGEVSAGVANGGPDGGAATDGGDAGAGDPHDVDPMALHYETNEELFALIKGDIKKDEAIFEKTIGVGASNHMNQGNKELSKHFIARAQCMAGLQGVTLQTEEQKKICGADMMVPIYRHGDMSKAKACIDVFEFPNKPCELPFVWIAPTQAKAICEAEGKRLCAQEEWVTACAADPEGGKPWKYSYGNELDIEICNTNKTATKYGPGCEPDSAKSAWKTCATNTEPSGSFPKCRSRLGVFDMQGNVAEEMARYDPDEGKLMDQLKGSAFFYVDVARDENGKPPPLKKKPTDPVAVKEWGRRTYPDICAHDPRWHVEPLGDAWHVNYHLGFRCCKTVTRDKGSKDSKDE